jgi:signal transduction histidine kinase
MSEKSLEAAPTAPPSDQPIYRPFPQLALAIRSQTGRIITEWRQRTLRVMPELRELSIKQFSDDIASILAAMADALESSDPPDLRRLVVTAPAHGFERFKQEYDLAELFSEERVLRRVIVEHVEGEQGLARRCLPDEAAALHSMIDIMLQQGVMALVQRQKQELRAASESQLKYLSFLSHDISNNFGVIRINLEFVHKRLAQHPEMHDAAGFLSAAMETMQRTRDGMRRLLEHEQLRNSNSPPRTELVELRALAEPIIVLARGEAAQKNVGIEMDIHSGVIAETNADLVSIILQNLIGNAVKHTSGGANAVGTIRITATRQAKAETQTQAGAASPHLAKDGDSVWLVSVADDGPGIPPEKLKGLFEAFKTIPQHGGTVIADEGGFGLGLAIVVQAARLLGTTIDVKTEVGRGSTFSFALPIPTGLL